MNVPIEHPPEDGRVPLFGTWRRAYAVVLAALVMDILLLYACTRLLA